MHNESDFAGDYKPNTTPSHLIGFGIFSHENTLKENSRAEIRKEWKEVNPCITPSKLRYISLKF